MTEAPDRTVVTSLTDLVEVVPSLLGFHAHDSVVLLAIESGHVVLTARADLLDAPVRALAAAWRRLPGARLVLIAFSPDAARSWHALDEISQSLPDGVERILVHADGERWFEHPHGEGTPYDALGSIHLARAAFAGRQVRRSREELALLVEPQRTPAEVTASLERVAASEGTLTDLLADARALLSAHDDAPGELDLDEATVLCLASHDDQFLAEAMLSTQQGNAGHRLSLWLQVVGASVPSCAGGALVAAGLAAWLGGDGALLSVCLEALLGRRGPQEWVTLLETVNQEAVPPQDWPALAEAMQAVRA